MFKNYLIAKEKFNPDFFLYENNKSAAQAIKDQIAHELGVGKDPKVRFTYINSALVSAQNRQRFYVTNFGDIEQPEDRGILLKDILEYGIPFRKDKSHCIDANYFKGGNLTGFNRQSGQRLCVAEPLAFSMTGTFGDRNASVSEKAYCLAANPSSDMSARNIEPVACRVRGRKDSNGKGYAKYECRDDSKSNTLDTNTTNGSMVAEPVCMRYERSEKAKKLRKQYEAGEIKHGFRELSELHPRPDGKTNTLSTVLKDNPICKPVRVGHFNKGGQGDRVYSIEGKSVCLSANGGGRGAKTGLYAIPVEFEDGIPIKAVSHSDGKTYPVYRVENGQITIKDKQYDIKLPDGYYIIRKLTPIECERLQTLPDNYTAGISNTQRYKCLGNGWTAEVIIHILKHMNIPLDEEIVVLSMYDGIATGRYCFDKMGYKNIKYYAYEIDKYAKQVAMNNYPNIIQCGDAFDIRKDNWELKI